MATMYEGRLLIEATAELTSALHVGSGHDEQEPLQREGGTSEIAAILRDCQGRPVIPGTTLKGVMRRLVMQGTQLDGATPKEAKENCDVVFGEIRHDDRGSPGILVPYAATLVSAGKVDIRVEPKCKDTAGTYVGARTAIDPASGTADDHKLFNQTVVAPGATFKLRLAVSRPQADFASAVGCVLVRVLKTWQGAGGLSVGRGRGDGWGRLRIVSLDRCVLTRIVPETGDVEDVDRIRELKQAVDDAEPYVDYRKRYTLNLSTDEPFFVKAPEEKQQREGTDRNTLRALRLDADHAELPGPSLMGVLRARATWYRDLRELRGQRVAATGDEPSNDEPSDPVDRLFGEGAGAVKKARDRGAKRTGWAGLLRLVSIETTKAPRATLTSVRIDRFSQAPLDGALFKVEAFVAPRFTATLVLDARAGDADATFAKALFDSLQSGPAKGLALGHAGNRGFGWFDVAVAEGD